VRLDAPGPALVVAEGIETALSAGHALRLPAWAALSAGGLARFSPPASVRRIVIAADNDAPGRLAAETLARTLRGAARIVEIAPPPHVFSDWNDWARAQPISAFD
jgi:putative DNA primase/helicase